jgi:two-component system response regulator FixJ
MEKPVVFVVSADAAVSDSVKDLLETAELSAEIFPSALAFLDTVGPDRRGCLVLDVQSGDQKDSVEQARLTAVYARMPAILITDRGDVPTAVEAVKAGAMEVVQKPYGDEKLLAIISHALQANAAAQG